MTDMPSTGCLCGGFIAWVELATSWEGTCFGGCSRYFVIVKSEIDDGRHGATFERDGPNPSVRCVCGFYRITDTRERAEMEYRHHIPEEDRAVITYSCTECGNVILGFADGSPRRIRWEAVARDELDGPGSRHSAHHVAHFCSLQCATEWADDTGHGDE